MKYLAVTADDQSIEFDDIENMPEGTIRIFQENKETGTFSEIELPINDNG